MERIARMEPAAKYLAGEWTMICRRIVIATAAICLVGLPAMTQAAIADATAPDSAGGRYMFEKQNGSPDGGYLRLDTQTGEVALCSPRNVGWACQAAPEDRAVLEDEIARLRAENAALKKEIISRGLPLPAGANPEPATASSAPRNSVTLPLPSNADIDRVVAYAGQLWHRLIDAVQHAQKQILNKS
ncbi:MAG TPA: hypothetical protein VL048_02375 [Xanthobacteraceae bacterium]|nr:hypothetical protein [Xanthobacteraceae bacterium]